MTLSSQLLWNYWSDFHETWYVDRTSYGVMHIGRKFRSPHFCGSYAPWNLKNIRKSTNNLSFLCQFFINEITASDAGPDIIRSHLFLLPYTNLGEKQTLSACCFRKGLKWKGLGQISSLLGGLFHLQESLKKQKSCLHMRLCLIILLKVISRNCSLYTVFLHIFCHNFDNVKNILKDNTIWCTLIGLDHYVGISTYFKIYQI